MLHHTGKASKKAKKEICRAQKLGISLGLEEESRWGASTSERPLEEIVEIAEEPKHDREQEIEDQKILDEETLLIEMEVASFRE
ncbi:MAG: hypothetical protein Q9157_008767, partial [Trypethelium eluteriae]